MKFTSKRKILIALASIVCVIALIIGAFGIYVLDYYHADEGAIAMFSDSEGISTYALNNGSIVFEPRDASIGFIFYPGGKVEHNAYQQLMASLARNGILCVIVKMPFNLAIFNVNAADAIKEEYPQIKNWYIGGHSLGGSMAAMHISKNIDKYRGLILLGSYSTSDISNSGLDVLSIYGSEDRVLNLTKYEENKPNLTNDFIEVIIDGGCHAYFGVYEPQKGDGEPTISNSEQIQITVDEIVKMIRKRG